MKSKMYNVVMEQNGRKRSRCNKTMTLMILLSAILVLTMLTFYVQKKGVSAQLNLELKLRLTESHDTSKKHSWTSKLSSVWTENWDKKAGACSGADTGPCTLQFRFPPQPVWNANSKHGGVKGVLDLQHPITGERDAGFVCALSNIDIKEDHWITGFEPLIDHFNIDGVDTDLVHHLDMFLCDEGIQRTTEFSLDSSKVCSEDRFMSPSAPYNMPELYKHKLEQSNIVKGPKCSKFGLVYDRGAESFIFPEGIGIKIGPSVAQTNVIVLQVHYLIPQNFTKPVWDQSGFRMILKKVGGVSRADEYEPASLLSFNDYGLLYPKGHAHIHHNYTIPASEIAKKVVGDFERFGNIQPFAMHLHAHATTYGIWVDHMRNNTKIGEYGRKDNYEADGKDQTFFLLPEDDRERPLMPGDWLVIHCLVNTEGAPHDIPYGIAHNTEMCAILMIYKNHDPQSTKNYPGGNMIAYLSNLERILTG